MADVFGSDGLLIPMIESIGYTSVWSNDGDDYTEVRTMNYKSRVYVATFSYTVINGQMVMTSCRTPENPSQFIWIRQ